MLGPFIVAHLDNALKVVYGRVCLFLSTYVEIHVPLGYKLRAGVARGPV